MRSGTRIATILMALGLLGTVARAQELSPRNFWPAPRGTKLVLFGVSHSSGDIITDPSLPVVGVDSRINTGLMGYLQILNVGGRTANVILEVPYTEGKTTGTLEGQPARRDVAGVGDIAVTFSANIMGAPTMTPAEFQELRRNPRPILGGSIKLVAPTGEYETDKLINVGTNRWSLKAELGYIWPVRPRWLLEFELGTWFFGDNDEFLGTTREQKPIVAFETHLIRRFRPGFWAALDLNFYTGGRTTVGGVQGEDLQRNGRIGATVVYPFGRRHAIKVGYSIGAVTESGGDFDTFLASYNLVLPEWPFGKKP
jgi:hypothetical protein